MRHTEKNKGSNKTTPGKYWLTNNELANISTALYGESKLIFQIMVATGQTFEKIADLKWDCLNTRLSTIKTSGEHYIIPEKTAIALDALREKAESETSLIFKQNYKQTWIHVSKVYFALGIDQSAGVLKLAKWTYARLHFQTYRNKTSLAKAMGITTCRHIPKQVFNITGPTPCLVQF